MLFYILVPIIFAVLVGTFCLVKYLKFNGNEKFDKVVNIILKVAVCTYCALMLLSIYFQIRLRLVFQKKNWARV